MRTHITGLTRWNVQALRDIDAEGKTDASLGATTATWEHGASDVLRWLDEEMQALPTKGHPRASLHAVRRKVVKAQNDEWERADAEALLASTNPIDEGTLAERLQPAVDGEFRPAEGEQFQVMRGYGHDDSIFRVVEYRPITAPPEKIQELYSLPALPTEAVECWILEAYKDKGDGETRWVGSARHSFPVDIMVPVGSTAKAYSIANGGVTKPRAPRQPGSGRCEHCGEPTKGGRFIPGHDAKLKGDLIREGTPEATAERVIRGWLSSGWEDKGGKVAKMVAKGDGFLRSRIAARIGDDPGKAE